MLELKKISNTVSLAFNLYKAFLTNNDDIRASQNTFLK